jgi:hypothetical protein
VTTPQNDRLLLNAYIDGELDPAHALEFEQRLVDSPELAAERMRIEALRGAMRERLPRETASPALRRRVAALARPRPFAADWGAKWGPSWGSGWAAMAASMAAAFVVGSVATYVAIGPGGREPQAELLVASHMRGLMASQPIDVASSDRHTVKPWFNGKLPQSPRVVASPRCRHESARAPRSARSTGITWWSGPTARSPTGRFPISPLPSSKISPRHFAPATPSRSAIQKTVARMEGPPLCGPVIRDQRCCHLRCRPGLRYAPSGLRKRGRK